ncbi:MAG: hypothetical protein HFG41_10415 [Coprococcus sp.]|nr:hypothetical protein [Coprococcus sp.]
MIDKDEYMKTVKYIHRIKDEAVSYVDGYVNHIKNIKAIEKEVFDRKYGRSTLKYFHHELGIS